MTLSRQSQRVLNALARGVRDEENVDTFEVAIERAERHLIRLEKELAGHRAASIALVGAYERGEANGGSTDWSDLDDANALAVKALGKKRVAAIRAQKRGTSP